jgi:hypothetical protein
MTVGVRFDDGQKLRIGRGKAGEKAEVVFKRLGANLYPAGARLHWFVLL